MPLYFKEPIRVRIGWEGEWTEVTMVPGRRKASGEYLVYKWEGEWTEVTMPKRKDEAAEQVEEVAGGEVTHTEVPGRRKASGEYLVYKAPEGQDFATSLVRAADAYAVKYAAYPSAVYVAQEDYDRQAEGGMSDVLLMGEGIPIEVAEHVEPGTVAAKIEHDEAA
jgi:hypothetical protein